MVDYSKMVRTSVFFFVVRGSLTGNGDSLVSHWCVHSTPHLARVTHANTFRVWLKRSSRFAACIVSCHFAKESSSQARFMSHAQCTWLDLIPLLLPHSAPSLLYPLKGKYLPQSATLRSVWPFCQTKPAHRSNIAQLHGHRAKEFVRTRVLNTHLHLHLERSALLVTRLDLGAGDISVEDDDLDDELMTEEQKTKSPNDELRTVEQLK